MRTYSIRHKETNRYIHGIHFALPPKKNGEPRKTGKREYQIIFKDSVNYLTIARLTYMVESLKKNIVDLDFDDYELQAFEYSPVKPSMKLSTVVRRIEERAIMRKLRSGQ